MTTRIDDTFKALKYTLELNNRSIDRYLFDEQFLLQLQSSFWKRLFCKHHINKHLKEILKRYPV